MFALQPSRREVVTRYSLSQLAIFLAVARHLGFSRAAAELHLSQPAVSKSVKDLERALGQSLFQRQGRRIALSDAGLLAQEYAQQLFEVAGEMERALAELAGLSRGRLRVGASEVSGSFFLPRYLVEFSRLYPGVQVWLHQKASRDIAIALGHHELDLALLEEAAILPQLQWDPLWPDELCLVVAPDHPLAAISPTVAVSQLLAEPWLLPEPGTGTRLVLERELESLGYRPRVILESGATPALVAAAAAGLGVGVISRRAAEEALKSGLLVALASPELDLRYRLGVAAAKDARLSPAALALAALLRRGAASGS